jgi:hypothetical protein
MVRLIRKVNLRIRIRNNVCKVVSPTKESLSYKFLDKDFIVLLKYILKCHGIKQSRRMHKWIVQDRDGREIYLTEERWGHIVQRHGELQNHFDEVLNTVRRGRRQ